MDRWVGVPFHSQSFTRPANTVGGICISNAFNVARILPRYLALCGIFEFNLHVFFLHGCGLVTYGPFIFQNVCGLAPTHFLL